MIDSVIASKALWFIITQLCRIVGVEVAKNKERLKAGLAITTRVLDDAP